MNGPDAAREYYRAIDEDDYAALSALLADGFVHERPDRTIEGRAAFVSFMRDGRPATDTEHVLEAVYEATADDRVAAEGRLLAPDGTDWFGFVDVFLAGDDGIARLRTYTDGG